MSFNLKACFCFYDIPRAQGICFLIIGLVGQLCRIDVFKALALYNSLLLLCCNVFLSRMNEGHLCHLPSPPDSSCFAY